MWIIVRSNCRVSPSESAFIASRTTAMQKG